MLLQRIFAPLVAGFLVLGGMSSAQATYSIQQQYKFFGSFGSTGSLSRSVNFATIDADPSDIVSARLFGNLFLSNPDFLCDDPANGVQGVCDTNGSLLHTTINIEPTGETQVEEFVSDFDCLIYGCLTFSQNARNRYARDFDSAEAAQLFSTDLAGEGVFLPDVFNLEFLFATICVSGTCDISINRRAHYQGLLKLDIEVEPGRYDLDFGVRPPGFVGPTFVAGTASEPTGIALMAGAALAGAVVVRRRRASLLQ